MAKLTTYYCIALSVCVNVILVTVVFRLVSLLYHQVDIPRSSTIINTTSSQSAIRSTKESLYAMYGVGDLPMDNEHLLNYIRSLVSRQDPGGRHLSSWPSRVDFSQMGGSRFVDGLLKGRRNGFFVECGAFTGEEYSDTLFFELRRNWTGILIEARPDYHQEILKKNRDALVLRACLASNRNPALVKYRMVGWGSGVSELNKNIRSTDTRTPETDVQCFSLNSIMEAIGVHHVDFMVLDVEGSEIPVLKTIDWTRLSVDVFSIEYSCEHRLDKLNELRQLFNETGLGYKDVGTLPLGVNENRAQDVVFMRV